MNRPNIRNAATDSRERISATGYSQGDHGGEFYRVMESSSLGQAKLIDFSSNTNALALELSRQLFAREPYPFEHYPDSSCSKLRKSIAAHEGLTQEEIVCGNGSAELIWLMYQTIRPSSVLFLGPAFSEHARACQALGIKCGVITPDADSGFACDDHALARLWDSRAELTVICTPNNPAGVTYDNMPSIFRALRSPWILVDLSYREFLYGEHEYATNNRGAYLDYISPGARLLTLHSFTKFFACPGMRLGYLTTDQKLAASLKRNQPSWSVSMHAQNMGRIFLENLPAYRATLPTLAECRNQLGMDLRRSPFFEPDLVLEGPNFFCCGLRGGDKELFRRLDEGKSAPARAMQTALLRGGFLIRDCDNIPGMPPGFVRIQSRDEADNRLLVEALTRLSR